jgi:hypothetical protein
MQFSDFQDLISVPRLAKYVFASNGNQDKAMRLYRANLRLSQELFAILSVFEIVLRNKIDQHYRLVFAPIAESEDWLLHAANPGGYLSAHGCQLSRKSVLDEINDLGRNYNHDKLVAELGFGFWRFQFASKEFMSAGSTLHKIFPLRPHKTNHTEIFNKLGHINKIRNRIAHHEPICFDVSGAISSEYSLQNYNHFIDLFSWMNVNVSDLLSDIDNVQNAIDIIKEMRETY